MLHTVYLQHKVGKVHMTESVPHTAYGPKQEEGIGSDLRGNERYVFTAPVVFRECLSQRVKERQNEMK